MRAHYIGFPLYICLSFLLLYTFPLVATTNIYWVSSEVNQNDAGDGSESSPWVGIETAIEEIRKARGQGGPDKFINIFGIVPGCPIACKTDIQNSP